ncbi:UNKNOWN [Stylonychia lemnae]|uniref:Uncharacterized protein n=1 Tax=Stylonychia lemnae TaxID=5949 RepID=A0A077ZV70_STYLE|nr:UNKNOWN [Stylonychia lemnae]|eukprot:CDW73795.1 UNKNOWN [Stylonychia lemnae]
MISKLLAGIVEHFEKLQPSNQIESSPKQSILQNISPKENFNSSRSKHAPCDKLRLIKLKAHEKKKLSMSPQKNQQIQSHINVFKSDGKTPNGSYGYSIMMMMAQKNSSTTPKRQSVIVQPRYLNFGSDKKTNNKIGGGQGILGAATLLVDLADDEISTHIDSMKDSELIAQTGRSCVGGQQTKINSNNRINLQKCISPRQITAKINPIDKKLDINNDKQRLAQQNKNIGQQDDIRSVGQNCSYNSIRPPTDSCQSKVGDDENHPIFISQDDRNEINEQATQTNTLGRLDTGVIITDEDQHSHKKIKPQFVKEKKREKVLKQNLLYNKNKSAGLNLKQAAIPKSSKHLVTNSTIIKSTLNSKNDMTKTKDSINPSRSRDQAQNNTHKFQVIKDNQAQTEDEKISNKATAATSTPNKNEGNTKIGSNCIQEVSKCLEESPQQNHLMKKKKLKTPKKYTNQKPQSETPIFYETHLGIGCKNLKKIDSIQQQSQQNGIGTTAIALSKTFDLLANDESQKTFYPSNKSNFSYEPKFYKPSRQSVHSVQKQDSVYSQGNSPKTITNSTTFNIDQAGSHVNFLIPGQLSQINLSKQFQQFQNSKRSYSINNMQYNPVSSDLNTNHNTPNAQRNENHPRQIKVYKNEHLTSQKQNVNLQASLLCSQLKNFYELEHTKQTQNSTALIMQPIDYNQQAVMSQKMRKFNIENEQQPKSQQIQYQSRSGGVMQVQINCQNSPVFSKKTNQSLPQQINFHKKGVNSQNQNFNFNFKQDTQNYQQNSSQSNTGAGGGQLSQRTMESTNPISNMHQGNNSTNNRRLTTINYSSQSNINNNLQIIPHMNGGTTHHNKGILRKL